MSTQPPFKPPTLHHGAMWTTNALCGARLPYNGRVVRKDEAATCAACAEEQRKIEVMRSIDFFKRAPTFSVADVAASMQATRDTMLEARLLQVEGARLSDFAMRIVKGGR